MASKLLVLGILLVAFALVEAKWRPQRDTLSDGNTNFDFFFFVQQWPGSFCDTSKGCCFPVTGQPGPYFGIHGMWPNRNDGSYPATCGTEAFDESQLTDVLNGMTKDWGTLACTSTHNEDFWQHEWSKHGTCSGFTQHDYFQNTIDLYNNYDITAALGNAGINPDDSSYAIADISSAIQGLLGFAPQLECNKDPQGNRQLFQVYICVAKDGKTLIDCPTPIGNPCEGSVQFPVFVSGSGDAAPVSTDSVGSAPDVTDKSFTVPNITAPIHEELR